MDAAAPPLPALTDEDVRAILTQLPLSRLPACAATCSQWARCVRSDGLLWSAGFASRFGGRPWYRPMRVRHAAGACQRSPRSSYSRAASGRRVAAVGWASDRGQARPSARSAHTWY